MKSTQGISYTLEGLKDAPVIVFSNSLGLDQSMWQSQVDALKDRFAILRYDTRGHGGSDQISTEFKIDDLGLDLIHLMDELGISEASYCGISLGGLTGMWLGIHHPKRFKHLVLANTAPKIASAEVWFKRIELVNTEGLASVAASSAPRWFTAEFTQLFVDEVKRLVDVLAQMSPVAYNSCCKVLAVTDVWSDLPMIQSHTMIIGGSFDMTTTVAEATKMATVIKNARLEILEAAHLSNVKSDAFTRLLIEFFAPLSL